MLTLAWVASSAAAHPDATDAQHESVLRVGVLAYRTPAVVEAQYRPVIEQLDASLDGLTLQLQILDLPAIDSAVDAGSVDLLYTNPMHFQLLRQRHEIGGALATVVRRGADAETTELGGVVVRAAGRAGPERWEQLDRWRIAAPGPTFLGGYQTQALELRRRDLPAPSDVRWLGTHEAVIDAVIAGDADVGFLRTGVLEQLVASGQLRRGALVVVEPSAPSGYPFAVSTALYPEWPVVALPHVPRSVVRRVAAALLTFEPAAATTGDIVGFDPPKDYRRLDQLALELRLPPYQDVPRGELRALWQEAPGLVGAALLLSALSSALIVLLIGLNRRSEEDRRYARDAAQLLRDIMDRSPLDIWRTDGSGRVVFANASAAERFGLSAGAREDGLFHNLPDGVARHFQLADAEALISAEPVRFTTSAPLADGAPHELDVQKVRALDAEGRTTGLITLVTDVTEARQAARVREQTAEADRLLDGLSEQLLRARADDIEAPLTAYLQAIARFVGASEGRLLIAEEEDERPTPRPLDVRRAEGFDPSKLPWTAARLARGEPVPIDGLDALPAEAALDREALARAKVRAAVYAPILTDEGRLLGVLALQDRFRSVSWGEVPLQLLRRAAQIARHALLRARLQRRLAASERHYRGLVEGLGPLYFFFVLDADGRLSFLSPSGEELFGYLRDAPDGLATARTDHPHNEAAAQHLDAALRGAQPPIHRTQLRAADGEARWLEISVGPLRDGQGAVVGVEGLAHDITARLDAELRLVEAEAYNRAVLDALPDLVLVIDRHSRVLDVRGPKQTLLAPLDQVLGRRTDESLPPDAIPGLDTALRATVEEGRPQTLTYALPFPDGDRHFEARMVRLDEERALALVRDTTEQVLVDQQLQYESALTSLLVRLAATYIHVEPHAIDARTDQALEALGDFVGADRSYVFRFDHDDATLTNTHEWCADGIEPMIERLQRVPLAMFQPWLDAFARDAALQIEDVAAEPAPELRAMLEDQSIVSLLAVPMRHDGVTIGLVGFDAVSAQRTYSPREVALLEVFARLQVNLLMHAEARAALDEQRERLATIVEGTATGTWIYRPANGSLEVNARWAEMLGYRLAELEPIDFRTWQRLSHPDDLAVAAERLAQNLRGELDYYEAEVRMRHRDGHWVWVLTRGRVVRHDADGPVLSGIHQDITERKRAEQRLAESEQRFRGLLEELPSVAVQGYGADLDVRFWNRGSELLYGWSREEATGHSLLELIIPPARQEHVRQDIQRWLRTGQTTPATELVLQHKDGSPVPVYSSHALQRNARGEVELFCIDLDLREQKAAAAQLQLAASVFTHSHEGILITDADANIVDVNDAFTRITGYRRPDVIGKNPRILSSGRHPPSHYQAMWEGLQRHGHWSGEIWNRRQDGSLYAEMLTISAVRDERDVIQHYVGLFADITAQKEQQRRLEQMAHYDVLTGLPNRVLLADRMRQAMAMAHRRGQRLAIAYIDLDGFKSINDTYGHDIGDRFLREVGARVRAALRESDTVARLGGDEFVAVLVDLPADERVQRLIDRLMEALSTPIELDGEALPVAASVGITFYPQSDELDADQLLRQADQAMYEAKHAGKNRVRYFDAALDRDHRARVEALAEIADALARGELRLHYQPKIDLQTREVLGVEGLLRWEHPTLGQRPPGDFLPLLQGEPLLLDIGGAALAQALKDRETWAAAGVQLGVSVNLAPDQLLHDGFVGMLRDLLAAHPTLPAGALTLEVLETSVLDDLQRTVDVIQACNALGVTFALDDFGTGYSSLAYLKHLPLTELKIDQGFVRDMLEDPEDLAIIRGVLGLGEAFHLRVVAEGAETPAHLDALRALGCPCAQGWGIAAAMPADAVPGWVRQWAGSLTNTV